MELSARIFGVNSWSILVPQALEGVAAVGLLYATVRRRFGAAAGLIAGLVLATTPVATLMFRFNNPDALLVLLLVAAAYAVTRALETASTRWLVVAGAVIGFGFITKMLQAFLVVPGFGAGLPRATRRRRCAGGSRSCIAALGGDRRRRRLVGRGGDADAGRRPAVHRRVDDEQRSCSSPSATTASAG